VRKVQMGSEGFRAVQRGSEGFSAIRVPASPIETPAATIMDRLFDGGETRDTQPPDLELQPPTRTLLP